MKPKLLLVSLLVLSFLLAGCNANATSSVESSEESSSAPVSSQTVSVDPGDPIEVTSELRAKYFDYFSQNSTERLPRFSFSSVGDLTEDQLVYYAVRNVKPIKTEGSDTLADMSTYKGEDLRNVFLKYFNRTDVDMNKSKYTYNQQADLLYLTRQADTIAYRYLMLTDLSQNSEGIYTAKFTVYNKLVGSPEEAVATTDEYRKVLITGKSNYEVYGTCTMSFKEIPDGNSYYIQFISCQTEMDAE